MRISAALSLFALAVAVVAAPAPQQIPLEATPDAFELLSGELRLISLSDSEPPVWMPEYAIPSLIEAGIKFMDITDTPDLGSVNAKNLDFKNPAIPNEPSYDDEVNSFISELSTDTMEFALKKLTSFRTRYYKSQTGAESARYLFKTISEIVADEEASEYVSVRKFKHPWDQFSIIARFEGSDESLSNEVVIVGAHQDSVNLWLPSIGPAPGADDDGSGTVTILEAFRVLVENGFSPVRPVEFHWYSAEEAGLLGSQAIARDYESRGVRVVAMLQEDMTGYIGPNGEVIGIVTDFVDEPLTNFLKLLADKYADIPYKNTKCGYACSDHASWAKAGYRSAFTIETLFEDSNKYIHTTADTIEKLSFDHMKEFAKVSVAFAVELSHPVEDS